MRTKINVIKMIFDNFNVLKYYYSTVYCICGIICDFMLIRFANLNSCSPIPFMEKMITVGSQL